MKALFDRLEIFDVERGWDRYNRISSVEERVDALGIETLNMLGEFGEFANELKKARRDKNFRKELLAEELTDMFIFLMKLSLILDIDLEEEFNKKMSVNEGRFAHFVKKEK